jgi:YidC/Oxa1 family membrane protein insertase
VPIVYANVLQPLINVTEAIMVFFHDHVFGGSWGLAIIALTVVVRAALIPLTLKQFRSMQALQRLSPQIKELQAKYKDDKQRLNQEMMRFYQENKVNPLGSCLPLAAQMPIFLALFYMLRHDLRIDICGQSARVCDKVDPGSASFLFIPDLTDKATGAVLVVLIVLYIGSQLASSLLMTVTADKNQRRMMIALPLIFVTFIINFPAGLIVYWITTNLWTIVQQAIVRRTVGPMMPAAAPAGAAAATAGGKPAKERAGPKSSVSAGGGGGGDGDGARAAPPPPPRKKKKRSGRRR